MLHFDTPDMTGAFPVWIFPAIIIAWVILMIIVLVSMRRAKIKRDRYRRQERRAAMRDSWIGKENAKDEVKYLENLPKTIKKYD